MEFDFRTVKPSELSTVSEIYEDGRRAIAKLSIDQWQGGYPSSAVSLRDIKNQQLYAVVEKTSGDIAAVAAMIPYEPDYDVIDGEWLCDGEKYFAVHRVASSADFVGTGAAKVLMDNIAKEAEKRGAVSLRIDTHRGNTVMQRFVAKCGFTECGLITLGSGEGDRIRIAYERIL